MQILLPLTVIFTTFNEEDNIQDALESVIDWADEIIVVDSFSTDKTPDMVKGYKKVQFLQHEYVCPAQQKNWAIPQATHAWIFIMDADERVTPKLKAEIIDFFNGINLQTQFDCFNIGFIHYFAGEKVKYSGWQNDKTIRLIKRDVCRYNQNKVHEEIITEGLSVGKLRHKLDHYTYKNVKHFVEKQMRYAQWSAEDKIDNTGTISYFHLLIKPLFRFLKHFIIKKGFLDGYNGFIISAVAAWTVFMRYLYIYEKQLIKKT